MALPERICKPVLLGQSVTSNYVDPLMIRNRKKTLMVWTKLCIIVKAHLTGTTCGTLQDGLVKEEQITEGFLNDEYSD